MKRRTFIRNSLLGSGFMLLDPVLGRAWAEGSAVSSDGSMSAIKKGGTMVVSFKDDPGTLDAAIGYNWENWSMIYALYSRLISYKPGATDFVPDAATDWDISDGGKKYKFEIRKNLKFFDGSPANAHDVRYSLERVINPATGSPGQSFYSALVGYEDMTKGNTKHVEGIELVDDYHINFHLKHPHATFLNDLALDFGGIVQKSAVDKYGRNFAHHPAGTGPFYVAEYHSGQLIVWKRNKYYYDENLPYLDEIHFKLGAEPLTAFFQLTRGQTDLLGDGIPGSQLARVKSNPKFKDEFVHQQGMETSYVALNTNMKPFDNKKVRQALNMAIDKDHIVKVVNGRGTVANQVPPPKMEGYDPNYKGYEYDPEKAKKLLAEAGYEDGFSTKLYGLNTAQQPKVAQAIQNDLKKIGVNVDLRMLSQAQVVSLAGTPDRAPMVWSGGLGWQADFPDPADFYWPILSCGAAVKGGWNWSFYCNKEVEKMADKAATMYQKDQHEARTKLWQQIYAKIMDDAPVIPVYNLIKYTMHSDRVAGKPSNVFSDPGIFPYNYAHMYSTKEQKGG